MFNFIRSLFRIAFMPVAGIVHLLSTIAGMLPQSLSVRIAGYSFGLADPSTSAILDRLEATARRLEPKDLLVAGKTREWIEALCPPQKYPLLYRSAPAELAYSLVADGRVLTGESPAAALGPTALTDEVVRAAYRRAVRAGMTAALVAMTIGAVGFVFLAAGIFHSDVAAPIIASVQASEVVDIWSSADLQRELPSLNRGATIGACAAWIVTSLAGLGSIVILAIVISLFAYTVGRFVWQGVYIGAVFNVAEARAMTVRIDPRDALQRWRWRREQRIVADAALAEAIDTIENFDRSPTINLGVASGTLAYRGHINAPMAETPVRLSVMDLAQNCVVIGATGEGKSRNFVTPFLAQLLDMRAEGLPVAIYLTDDKGALWSDLAAEAAKRALQLRIIGTAPGQMRVDLMAGTEPGVFASVLASTAKQMGGARGEDFFPDSAAALAEDVAIFLQAHELTDAGAARVSATGVREYSIKNFLYYGCNLSELRDLVPELAQAFKDPAQHPNIARYDTPKLHAAIESIQGFLVTLHDGTLTGIQATLRKALRPFVFDDVLSQGFADGAGENLVPLSELHGNFLTAINVSSIEHGAAGKLVNVLLKTVLFRAARAAEARDPESRDRRLAWWSNPSKRKAEDSDAFIFFVGDEYQGLITGGGTGVDDSTFWNVNRSAGIVGVVLTQSIAAFEMVLGREATENFMGNFRTKIFMRTESVATIDYVVKLAGKAVRYDALSWSAHDSQVTAMYDGKADPDALLPVDVEAVMSKGGLFSSGLGVGNLLAYAHVYELDQRFISAEPGLFATLAGAQVDTLSQRQAAAWRQEDRNASVLSSGRQEVDTVRPEDLMSMGRGRAIAFIQRAGVTRVDLVDLTKRVAA